MQSCVLSADAQPQKFIKFIIPWNVFSNEKGMKMNLSGYKKGFLSAGIISAQTDKSGLLMSQKWAF